MPAFTLGELMSIGTTRAGRRADIPVSEASLLVNLAYLEVQQAIPHNLSETTTELSVLSGERYLNLPSNYAEPVSFRLKVPSSQTTPEINPSYKTLALLSPHQADGSWTDDTGEPQTFAFFGSRLELHPSPNSNYSLHIRYRAAPTDMLELTDTPSLSTPWRLALLSRSEVLFHEHVGNYPAAASALQRYLSMVNTLKTDEAKRQSSGHRQTINPVYPKRRYRG
jgi:hypothetical protein